MLPQGHGLVNTQEPGYYHGLVDTLLEKGIKSFIASHIPEELRAFRDAVRN